MRKLRAAFYTSAALILPATFDQALAACDTTTPCVTGPTALGGVAGLFISQDGAVVAGSAGGSPNTGFVWSNGTYTTVGTLYGRDTSIYDLSADGTTAVGSSPISNSEARAFTWTAATGMVELAVLAGGTAAAATAVNANGSVIVGWSNTATERRAVSWVNGTVNQLSSLGGTLSEAADVSANGSVIVGYSYTGANDVAHGVRWVNGAITDLGSLGLGDTYAQKVSADGSTVIGTSGSLAFRWNNGAMIALVLPGGFSSDVAAVTPDGSAVIGASDDGNGANHAYRWKDGVITDLTPMDPRPYNSATAISNNGEVVVGYSGASLANTRAWRWTAATGNVELNTLLANAGVNMTGINLRRANAISGDGQWIAGGGVIGGVTQAYIVRYDDGAGAIASGTGGGGTGPVAGITTPDSQQQSVNALADQRTGMMAQEHGLAAQLLGGDKSAAAGGEAGVYASGGSATAGGHVRYTSASGLSVMAGAAWAREDYANTELKNSWIGAGAVQYIYSGFGEAVRPLVEAGGWYSPNASLSFSRNYSNGAGTATGIGNTRGDLSYAYGRLGAVIAAGGPLQFIVSGEYGRQKLSTAAYAEGLTANPFNATVSGGTDAMDVLKARLQGSYDFGKYDATLWGAYASGFNRSSSNVTTVAGLGALQPSELKNVAWAEYGVRLGYKVTQRVSLDVFANGVSGGSDIGTRIHGGAGVRVRF
ncbi:MAG: hypothetical protein JSR72_08345 [Proteobacteria bacterium]|nr:hypothetical protein [Pseudomonadota bacterium]